MKWVFAQLVSLLVRHTASFRGKVRLLRLLGRLCQGEMVRGRYGAWMEADLGDNTNLWGLLGWYDEVAVELEALNEGDAFIDIGANAGVFSLMAGKKVGDAGCVVAFEPQLVVYQKLVANIRRNRLTNILAFPFPVSSVARLMRPRGAGRGHTGATRFESADSMSEGCVWGVVLPEDMPIIDRLLGRRNVVVKIDVEGAELDVLRGIETLLQRGSISKIVVEIDENNLAAFGACPKDIYDYLEGFGFDAKNGLGFRAHFDEVFIPAAESLSTDSTNG